MPMRPPPKLKKEMSWSTLPCDPGGFNAWYCWLLFTLESSSTRPNTFRMFSGSSTACLLLTSEPMSALPVTSTGALASTSTVWDTAPSVQLGVKRGRLAHLQHHARQHGQLQSPAFRLSARNGPAGISVKVYWPVSPVVNWRRKPVSEFDRVTCAPGTGALFGSVIVPASVGVDRLRLTPRGNAHQKREKTD